MWPAPFNFKVSACFFLYQQNNSLYKIGYFGHNQRTSGNYWARMKSSWDFRYVTLISSEFVYVFVVYYNNSWILLGHNIKSG